MKKTILPVFLIFITMFGCNMSDAGPEPPLASPTTSLSPSPSRTATVTFSPTFTPHPTDLPTPTEVAVYSGPGGPLDLYADVRDKNLSALTGLAPAFMRSLWFNQHTTWPASIQAVAQQIIQDGMNPGLGVRALQAQGITGQGVIVAIIDQNMLLDHPEFAGKVIQYKDFGTNMPAGSGSMHGPAVTSLLVGEQIGTAPGAKLYYASVPSWSLDAQYYADALDWIISINSTLPDGGKIRVVSVSAAPSGEGTLYTAHTAAWDSAYLRATEAGLLVLDCTQTYGVTAECYYDPSDPENPAKCFPGEPGWDFGSSPDSIYVPSAYRTTAEEYQIGETGYQYSGRAGLSWTEPYLAGVLAMGWQLRPDLDGTTLLQLIFDSAYLRADGLKIINPPAFIALVQAEP